MLLFKEQVAGAASNDMGLTTTIFPNENCTSSKSVMKLIKPKMQLIYQMKIGCNYILFKKYKTYAKDTKEYNEGLALFEKISCSKCHIKFWYKKVLKYHLFWFLLHDMGEDLADGRVDLKHQSEANSTFMGIGTSWKK